jgi:hypothetical protein
MNCGSGTNTKGELLDFWCLLYFACNKNIAMLHLFGDSKVITEWFNHVNDLHVISLLPWMRRIKVLSGKFTHVKSQHIYRTYNQEIDQL